ASVVVALIYAIWAFTGRKIKDPNRPPRWAVLCLYACVAGVSHILLDFTNAYGVRPFSPFSEKWYSWAIVSIVEPTILGFLVLALLLPAFFSLISEESGERRKGAHGRLAATLVFLVSVLVWGVRAYCLRRALSVI